MKKIISALALALLALPVSAADFSSSAIGTTAADFLNLGVGGRATAMGGAYSAVADDATALYWNPAAMTQVPDASVAFMHAAYIASSYFDYAAYVQNLGQYGSIGLGMQYFSAGSIAETDASDVSLGNFSPYDLAMSLGYAYQFHNAGALDGLSLGVTAKYIESKILATAQTEALDLGLLSPAYFDDKLRLALTVRNLGGGLKYEQVTESLPMAITLGSAYKITDLWQVSLDVTAPKDDAPYLEAGTEYWLAEDGPWKFAARAGYDSQTLNNITGFTGGSVGVGIDYGGLDVDMAFVPYGGVGQAERISLTYNFGGPKSDKQDASSNPDPGRREASATLPMPASSSSWPSQLPSSGGLRMPNQ